MLAEQLAEAGIATVVAQGAPTAERLVARVLFDRVARRTEVATDDGSAGERGFVTAVTARLLAAEKFDVVYTCGPEVMERAVIAQCQERGVACQVSLERLMACGIGACLSCVVTTKSGLKRACVDGPVFDAEEVLFDATEIPPKH
jgi:dihydroorotate dehydrogenase electron transfer subunit